jgi:hypothetical protein
MLKKEELIVRDPSTKEDVVAVMVTYDIETGTIWAKIGPGNVVVTNSIDVLKRNTEENIAKVFANQ